MEQMVKRIKSSFWKIKRYYYENDGLLYFKKKIADFECSHFFDKKLISIAEKLYNYEVNIDYFQKLINKSKIIELSKNVFYVDSKLNIKSNYFIDLPVELLIIDALLVCEFGILFQDIIAVDNNTNVKSYNNKLNFSRNNLYNDFNLFEYYKKGYDQWKREPYDRISGKDACTVIKLDIKQCYYSAKYELDFFYSVAKDNQLVLRLLDIYFNIADKYKESVNLIHAKKINNQCFPIGLLSSNILFEYFMYKNVDSKFYDYPGVFMARYTDDMLFIIDGKHKLDGFFNKFPDVFSIKKRKNKYNNYSKIRYIKNTGFKINNNKIKMHKFVKNDPYCKYKIKKLFEKNAISEQNIVEFELSEKPKYDSNGNETDMNILRKAQKIMDIYLDYEKIDENDKLVINFKKDINSLFSTYKLINYRISWTKIFEFIILVNNKDKSKIDECKKIAKKTITESLKGHDLLINTLLNELDISSYLAMSSFNMKIKENRSIRKSLMYKIFEKNVALKILNEKKEYIPYLISSKERLFNYLFNSKNGYPKNHIFENAIDSLEIENKQILKTNYLINCVNFDKYSMVKEIPKIGCIVANIKVTEKSVEDALKRGTLTFDDKKVFLDLLEGAKKIKNTYGTNVKYLVFPEFFLDYLWIKDVIDFCKKTGITIISGMMLKKYVDSSKKKKVINNLFYFIPFKGINKRMSLYIGMREKNHYSPAEEKFFSKLKLWHNESIPEYHLIKKDNFIYNPMLCYEFTNPQARYVFNGLVHAIFISELNQDTYYFSSIIHSTSRELHSFVIQANSSVYGDTRITKPSSSNKMNMVSVKGGLNSTLHYVELDVIGLLDSEKQFDLIKEKRRKGKKISEYNGDFKKTSAGFKRITLDDFFKIHKKNDIV